MHTTEQIQNVATRVPQFQVRGIMFQWKGIFAEWLTTFYKYKICIKGSIPDL